MWSTAESQSVWSKAESQSGCGVRQRVRVGVERQRVRAKSQGGCVVRLRVKSGCGVRRVGVGVE